MPYPRKKFRIVFLIIYRERRKFVIIFLAIMNEEKACIRWETWGNIIYATEEHKTKILDFS